MVTTLAAQKQAGSVVLYEVGIGNAFNENALKCMAYCSMTVGISFQLTVVA